MIALRSDIIIEPKQIAIRSKAEILSIELKLNDNDVICLTTCYRVGTLCVTNHKEVDNHLRTITRRNKYSFGRPST